MIYRPCQHQSRRKAAFVLNLYFIMTLSISIPTTESDEDSKWETVIDFTQFREGGIPVGELIEILEHL